MIDRPILISQISMALFWIILTILLYNALGPVLTIVIYMLFIILEKLKYFA
jgi:hypothetical protein